MGKVMTIDRPEFQRGVNDIYSLKPLRRALLAVSKEMSKGNFSGKCSPKSRGAAVVKSTGRSTGK